MMVGLTSTGFILNGFGNIFLAEWLRKAFYYTPEFFFISVTSVLLGLLLLFRWKHARRIALVCACAYLALSLAEFLLASYLIHMIIPLAYFFGSTIFVMILSTRSVKIFFEGKNGMKDPVDEWFDSGALRKGIVIFGIWNLILGILNLGHGGEGSLNNLFVRFLGFSLISASLGLFGRYEWARKAVLIFCVLSFAQVIVNFEWTEYPWGWSAWTLVLAVLFSFPSLIFFTRRRVQQQFR